MIRLILLCTVCFQSFLFAQQQIPPWVIRGELTSVENQAIVGEQNNIDKLRLGKITINKGYIQQRGRYTSSQYFEANGGRSFDGDREFSNATAIAEFTGLYKRSSLNFSLIGDWGKGRDFSESLTLLDTNPIEDPNKLTDRYLRGQFSYVYILSSLNEIGATVAHERSTSFNQETKTNSLSLFFQQVLSTKSSLGINASYRVQNSEVAEDLYIASLAFSYDYRINERNFLTLQLGQLDSQQDANRSQNTTAAVRYLHLFFRNQVLQKWNELTPNKVEQSPIEQTNDKLIQQVVNQSLSNSLSLSWDRNYSSAEQGSQLTLADTSSFSLNSELSETQALIISGGYTKRSDEGLNSETTEDSRLSISYNQMFSRPVPGEPPPLQYSLAGSASKTRTFDNDLELRRFIITLALFAGF